jgi:hypothetical protein
MCPHFPKTIAEKICPVGDRQGIPLFIVGEDDQSVKAISFQNRQNPANRPGLKEYTHQVQKYIAPDQENTRQGCVSGPL